MSVSHDLQNDDTCIWQCRHWHIEAGGSIEPQIKCCLMMLLEFDLGLAHVKWRPFFEEIRFGWSYREYWLCRFRMPFLLYASWSNVRTLLSFVSPHFPLPSRTYLDRSSVRYCRACSYHRRRLDAPTDSLGLRSGLWMKWDEALRPASRTAI